MSTFTKNRTPAGRPGLAETAVARQRQPNYILDRLPCQDPIHELWLDLLGLAVTCGNLAELYDGLGDRRRFWAVRRAMLMIQAAAWTLSEAMHGRQ